MIRYCRKQSCQKNEVPAPNVRALSGHQSAFLQDLSMINTNRYLMRKYREKVHPKDHYGYIVATVMDFVNCMGYQDNFSTMNRRGLMDSWKFGLLILREFTGKSFREFNRCLGSFHGVLGLFGNRDLSIDESTIRKFSYRIDEGIVDMMIMAIATLCSTTRTIVAVDGTGFYDSNASLHYVRKIGHMIKERSGLAGNEPAYSCTEVKGFVKATVVADVKTKAIFVADVVTDMSADVRRFIPAMDKMKEYGPEIEQVLADKGYDAEYIHRYLKDEFGCIGVIPVRKIESKKTNSKVLPWCKGILRRRIKNDWEEIYAEPYSMRSIVKAVNSMVKRRISGFVRNKKNDMKKLEVKLKVLAHNINVLMEMGFA